MINIFVQDGVLKVLILGTAPTINFLGPAKEFFDEVVIQEGDRVIESEILKSPDSIPEIKKISFSQDVYTKIISLLTGDAR